MRFFRKGRRRLAEERTACSLLVRDALGWRANHTGIKQRECSISIRDCAGLAAISVLLHVSLKRKKRDRWLKSGI
jgi:hypothetical protein